MIDVVTYTQEKTIEHLCLIEEHLEDYLATKKGDTDNLNKCFTNIAKGIFGRCSTENIASFCLDCLAKHTFTLKGLAGEGIRYVPGKAIFYTELKTVMGELENDLPNFDQEKAKVYIDALRNIRKKMISEYLILGTFNQGQESQQVAHEHIR